MDCPRERGKALTIFSFTTTCNRDILAAVGCAFVRLAETERRDHEL